ncbi:MAG: hypothetical protein IKO36_03075 [Bacteroidaceae bacterium]|nr:hypothetical protein [Bacteroidaceae bacterium]
MTKENFIKGKDNTIVQAEINEGVVTTNNLKKVTNLSKNEIIYEQGDGILKIAPFDNYYLFTIYSEMNLEDVPVDLHNMGSFYLTFKDKSNEIRIKNYTNTNDVKPVDGQILFKISQEEAEKILTLETNVFYVTSMISDDVSKSDETVIYSGKFFEYNEASIDSLTQKIADLKKEINDITNAKDKEISELNNKINELSDTIIKLKNEYNSLNDDLNMYKNMYSELCEKTGESSEELNEKTNQSTVNDINNTLKRYNLIEQAKTSNNKLTKTIALNSLKQHIIGIKSINVDTTVVNKKEIELNTADVEKKILANIVIKKGVISIYAFIPTMYSSLNTEEEKANYDGIADMYNYIKNSIKNNDNIEFNIIYKETDYGSLINKYNIQENCILIFKNNLEIGRIMVNNNDESYIISQITQIINNNE